MCCFSQDIGLVSNTNIFARGHKGSQFLVYQMTYAAPHDLAMVLPLPVPPQSGEDAVRFINLEGYPLFFEHMQHGFPSRSAVAAGSRDLSASGLAVHDVGMYEASFVPTINDFSRLDFRFQFPQHIWAKLPAYHDFGFAVFKLKSAAEPQAVHPMAFEFLRRNDLLYFPTLHIHDGEIHSHAEFDHMLYCQPNEGMQEYLANWHRSSYTANQFMDVDAAQGIVQGNMRVWKLSLKGKRQNVDSFVGHGGAVPNPVSRKNAREL
jgi:hypothetical protein